MEKKDIKDAVVKLKADAKARKFSQSYDVVVSLRDIDLKKTEQQVDFFFVLPHGCGKKKTVCGLVSPELGEEAKKTFDHAIVSADFERLTKKEIKALAEKYDYFVASANVMTKIAAVFGRILGPRAKMPNPKAGCVLMPKANLAQIQDQLSRTVRLRSRNLPMLQTAVGNDTMDADKIVENISLLYDAVIHHLPEEANNVKHMYIKLSMSKAIKVL